MKIYILDYENSYKKDRNMKVEIIKEVNDFEGKMDFNSKLRFEIS